MTLRGPRALGAVLFTLGILAACDTIVARPLTDAPLNVCPDHACDGYAADAGAAAAAVCKKGRCELPSAASRPDYPFWIVVNLPDTSFFAPGLTYVFFSGDHGDPAFQARATSNLICNPRPPVPCLQIGGDALLTGTYTATADATTTVATTLDPATLAPIAPLVERVSQHLPADQAIPVRVMLTPTGNTQTVGAPDGNFPTALPLEPIVLTSGTNSDPRIPSTNDYGRALLAGTYQRELYPEPPFDAIYPPTSQSITFTPGSTAARSDLVLVSPAGTAGTTPGQALDFSTNQCSVTGTQQDSRCAVVTREDGLDGWRVWIEDAATRKRISVVRTFSNTLVGGKVSVVTQAAALLYTALRPTLGDGFNAVVAPPEGFLGVPRLETPLFGGTQGLQTLVVPTFPPPVAVRGVVAEPGDAGALLGYAARVTLVSTSLTTTPGTSPLLHYEATVSTDDRGRFATVVPPGTYTATIEPAIGTGFAKATASVVVDRTVTALTLQPPARPVLRGRALLTDGRALAEGTVLAEPQTEADGTVGRPGRATTDADGAYAIELDPGSYVLSVLPKAGTGFPRVVTTAKVGTDSATLADIHIPPPTPLSLTLRDPAVTGNPIVRAVVRIFASPPGNLPPVEIGNAMTDANGLVEILLAQQPQ